MTAQFGFHGSDASRKVPTMSIGNFRLASRGAASDKSDKMDVNLLRKRIRERMDATGWKPVPLAKEIGRGRDYIRDFLQGTKNSLSMDTLPDLARELKCDVSYFLDPEAEAAPATEAAVVDLARLRQIVSPPEPSKPKPQIGPFLIERRIPVMGDVAAGLWKEAVAREVMEAEEHIDVDVPGYERARLYALRVVGPSVNLVYAPGGFVVVAPAAEAGVRIGDFVIVERSRADLVELTIKELTMEDGKAVLRPRSSDPAFQTPIPLEGDEADQTAPKVIGVVVAYYRKTERPPSSRIFELPT